MTFLKVYNIKRIRSVWEELYSESEEMLTPYQSYSINYDYYNSFYFSPKRWKYKPVFVVAKEAYKVIAIIPCCESKNYVEDFCSQSPIDYYDWIVSPKLKDEDWNELFEGLKKLFNGKKFFFHRIRNTSKLFEFFNTKSNEIQITEDELCGNNLDCSDWDNWYNDLSKHMRQNLRTAYNKIQKENKSLKLHVFTSDNWNENTFYEECRNFYEDRCFTKNHMRFRKIKDILRRKYNPIGISLSTHRNRIMFVLTLDGLPVSFFAGFFSNTENLVIPRLSMNEKYSKYDVVSLLVSEAIKYLNTCVFPQIKMLDLTRGGEPYKFKLGAKEAFIYKCSFN